MLFRVLMLCFISATFCWGQPPKVVTIFPFHFASADPSEKQAIEELNEFFYDLFAGQLVSSDYFEVVDRQHMKDLLGEVALQQSGLTEQVIQLGKMKGAELAIFGTVTKVGSQTFLTMKIIDISTAVIIKAAKQKGSLNKPDELALEAGYDFMQGLSQALYQRYGVSAINPGASAKAGLKEFFKGRDLFQQARIADDSGDHKKMKKFRDEGEKCLEKAYQFKELQPAIDRYREEVLSNFPW
jgi:TolB-like protein